MKGLLFINFPKPIFAPWSDFKIPWYISTALPEEALEMPIFTIYIITLIYIGWGEHSSWIPFLFAACIVLGYPTYLPTYLFKVIPLRLLKKREREREDDKLLTVSTDVLVLGKPIAYTASQKRFSYSIVLFFKKPKTRLWWRGPYRKERALWACEERNRRRMVNTTKTLFLFFFFFFRFGSTLSYSWIKKIFAGKKSGAPQPPSEIYASPPTYQLPLTPHPFASLQINVVWQ